MSQPEPYESSSWAAVRAASARSALRRDSSECPQEPPKRVFSDCQHHVPQVPAESVSYCTKNGPKSTFSPPFRVINARSACSLVFAGIKRIVLSAKSA